MSSNNFRAANYCLAVLLAALAIPLCFVGDAKAASKGSMILFGSSSMNGSFGHLIADDFAQLGYRVIRHGYAAAGLARPDFRDLRKTLERLPIDQNTKSVLLYVGGNDAQSLWLHPEERPNGDADVPWVGWNDKRWPAIYTRRATEMIRSVCARGAQHVIVLPPADVTNPRLQERLDRVRSILRRAARATDCGHYVSTSGDAGQFHLVSEPLRAGDGVHMTHIGAVRVWKRVRDAILGLMSDSVASLH